MHYPIDHVRSKVYRQRAACPRCGYVVVALTTKAARAAKAEHEDWHAFNAPSLTPPDRPATTPSTPLT